MTSLPTDVPRAVDALRCRALPTLLTRIGPLSPDPDTPTKYRHSFGTPTRMTRLSDPLHTP